jgi:hypothetical protein
MAASDPAEGRLPKGVQRLARARHGRRYRARIRQGKRGEIHLGLYETLWLAAFAYNVAAQAVGRAESPPNPIPHGRQPTSDEVHAITAKVRRRLGLDPPPPPGGEIPPSAEGLRTLFDVAVVGFWRSQAAEPHPEADALDGPARRLLASADLMFWSRSPGHPTPLDVLADAVADRFDAAFRNPDLTREVHDDDGDDPLRLARWLVYPDSAVGGRGRAFRAEVRHLYPDLFDGEPHDEPGVAASWAVVLGIEPPYTLEKARRAYRTLSRQHHPDAGGTEADFLRLKAAFEAARRYCDDLDT